MTDPIVYITLSIAWGAGCFLGGVATGTRLASLMEVTRLSTPVKTPSKNPVDNRSWFRRGNAWLGVFVAAIGLVTVLQWYIQGSRTDEVVRCQQAYVTGFADALDARSTAARDQAEKQDELWFIVNRGFEAPSPDLREEFRKKLAEYVSARQKAKEAPPIPEPPRSC